MLTSRCFLATLVVGGLAVHTSSPPALAQSERVHVVATFSILGDLVKNVGGDRITLTTLVGPDGDSHVYSPTPSDARRLAEAKLIIANGLNFEGWLDRMVRASGTKALVIAASKGVKAPEEESRDSHAKKHAHHSHGSADPHAWQSVVNVKSYVRSIRDALVSVDAAGREAYETNTTAYLAKLDELEAEVKAAIETIPASQRKIITSHDAFAYFEKAYGLDFIAPQGVSTEAEASAQDAAKIIRQIKKEKISAVFLENVSDARLVERIARETGAKVGGRLYSDALSEPSGPAGTYIDMMRHNIGAIRTALTS